MTTTTPPPVQLATGPLATGLRIGGSIVDGHGPRLDVPNPATGEVLASAAGGESILLADVSAARVAAVRDRYPFLPDRR